jgi:hypothetical protein
VGVLDRFRSAPDYQAVSIDEEIRQSATETTGTLLRIVPHKENEGIVSAAGLLQSIHDGPRAKVSDPDPHTYELWFDEGKIKFFLHAATDRAAKNFTRHVESNYENTDVHPVEGGRGFPSIESGEHVAAAELGLEKHHYYPIRHHNAEGFESDPYSEILTQMLSTDESRIVVQVAMRSAPKEWANGSSGLLRPGDSVDDVAEGLRNGRVVGWLDSRIRDASKKDKKAAGIIEQQRGKYAFNTNIRILAISPDSVEATARCKGVAGMFIRYYNSATEQGFEGTPVAPDRIPAVVDDCHQRAWYDQEMVMTIDELAGVAHIPNKEINTPNVDWKSTRRGTPVSPDAAQHESE